ncbi:glycosyltransferase [soil metagenome]
MSLNKRKLKLLFKIIHYNTPFVKKLVLNFSSATLQPAKRKLNPGNKILMLTISQIEIDSRINKTAKSLAENGYDVFIIAYHTLPNQENFQKQVIQEGITYIRVNQPQTYRVLNGFIQQDFIEAAKYCEFDFVHANDLTTVLTSWLLARKNGCPLIYDSHELWSDNVTWNGKQYVRMKWWKRFIARLLENNILSYVDSFYTVSPSIVNEYEKRVNKKPLLLPNYPDILTLDKPNTIAPSIRTQCNLSDEHFITLYLGGIGPARNIETVIKAHQFLDKRFVFVIRGPSIERYGQEYLDLARSIGVGNRIFLLPAVGRDDIIAATKGADCGIVMLENLCKNFYWFYPNKFFEYSLAGLPVAVSNFPDVSAHIAKERNGVTFNPSDAKSIAHAINVLASDIEEARAMGQRGRASILREYNWHNAFNIMLKEYKRLSEQT